MDDESLDGYCGADPDAARKVMERRKALPRIKRLHSWGGQARAHDFEMTDGTIRTLTESEAEQLR